MSEQIYPLVTIVTPSFNQGEFLEETILSVLKQDYPNIEYIIIDGGSSDNSVDIISKYEKELAFWVSEPDDGQSHAIMKGFEKSSGKYITWLCSDDILEPSAISISVAFFEKNSQIVLTFGNRTRIDAKGNVLSYSRKGSFYSYYLKNGFTLPQETTLIRKEAYLKTEGVNKNLKMVMDFDLWCKLLSIGPFIHIPAFLGRFRTHQRNKSTMYTSDFQHSGFHGGMPAEHAEILRKHFKKTPSKWRRKAIGLIYQAANFMERRMKKYKRKRAFVEQFRAQL